MSSAATKKKHSEGLDVRLGEREAKLIRLGSTEVSTLPITSWRALVAELSRTSVKPGISN